MFRIEAMSLKGKIVFVTGASSGIGAATALAFAAEGARLLLAARRPESVAVLEAFLRTEMGAECRLLDAEDVQRNHAEAATPELLAALWSPHELRVESREAIPRLAAWLEARHGVSFLRETAVLAVETSKLVTTRGEIEAEAIAVCPGDDLVSLFADRIAAHGVTRCKLQMLRLADPGFRLSAGVMSDLGWRGMPAMRRCPRRRLCAAGWRSSNRSTSKTAFT